MKVDVLACWKNTNQNPSLALFIDELEGVLSQENWLKEMIDTGVLPVGQFRLHQE